MSPDGTLTYTLYPLDNRQAPSRHSIIRLGSPSLENFSDDHSFPHFVLLLTPYITVDTAPPRLPRSQHISWADYIQKDGASFTRKFHF